MMQEMQMGQSHNLWAAAVHSTSHRQLQSAIFPFHESVTLTLASCESTRRP